MKPTSTAVDIATDALVSLARDALPDVQVLDGPWSGQEPNRDALIVGYSDGEEPSVVVTATPSDACGSRRHEEADIVCLVGSYSGDSEMKPRRDRCKTILQALYAVLRDNPGLGRVVDGAWLGESSEWVPRQTRRGAVCKVAFTVHYVAEI